MDQYSARDAVFDEQRNMVLMMAVSNAWKSMKVEYLKLGMAIVCDGGEGAGDRYRYEMNGIAELCTRASALMMEYLVKPTEQNTMALKDARRDMITLSKRATQALEAIRMERRVYGSQEA